MFLHYLKTALRNIKSNWVYTILSICCLAIGTAMFSAFFYGVNYDYYKYNRRPLHNRCAKAYEDIPGDDSFNNNRSFIQRGGTLPIRRLEPRLALRQNRQRENRNMCLDTAQVFLPISVYRIPPGFIWTVLSGDWKCAGIITKFIT